MRALCCRGELLHLSFASAISLCLLALIMSSHLARFPLPSAMAALLAMFVPRSVASS
jgi:hypothetical protein